MAVTRTVRVTRTWDFTVEAEYGDTYTSLCEKVGEELLDQTTPQGESRVVLEEHESAFDTLVEWQAANPAPAPESVPVEEV